MQIQRLHEGLHLDIWILSNFSVFFLFVFSTYSLHPACCYSWSSFKITRNNVLPPKKKKKKERQWVTRYSCGIVLNRSRKDNQSSHCLENQKQKYGSLSLPHDTIGWIWIWIWICVRVYPAVLFAQGRTQAGFPRNTPLVLAMLSLRHSFRDAEKKKKINKRRHMRFFWIST